MKPFVDLLKFARRIVKYRPDVFDPDEASDYRELQRASIPMTRQEFHAIRQANLNDKEQFGDGSNAPYWPSRKWNGDYSLHRGVWIDDAVPQPPDSVLDAVREKWLRSHRVLKFTLVEGEQDAPYGKNGAMIRVRARTGIPGVIHEADGSWANCVPCVNVQPVNPDDGTWGSSFLGTLPCEISIVVKDKAP